METAMTPKKKPAVKELPAKPVERDQASQVKGGGARLGKLASNHNQALRRW
jgi:hypothetical protein